MTSQSNNSQSKSPSKEQALYDEFLEKEFSKDKGASSQLSIKEAFQSCCDHINRFSGSSDKPKTGDEGVSQGDSNASLNFTEEEKQQFLEKIYQPVARDYVHGFDYDEKSLKMMLLNKKGQDSFQLIGVVGKLGVGKTALCRLILDEEEVKQRFVPRLLIPLSESGSESEPESEEPKSMENVGKKMPESEEPKSIENVVKKMPESEEPGSMENVVKKTSDSEKAGSMEKAVKKMLEHLGVEEDIINFISEHHELPGLLYALHLHLKGKKFLIVLDDVQEQADYYKNLTSCLSDGHGFPKGSGGAIILTSRNEEAIKRIVGEQNLHRLLPLSDPESCWPIYETLALGEDGIHPYPRPIASKEVQEELKNKCGGLPLVARIMGELKHREKM